MVGMIEHSQPVHIKVDERAAALLDELDELAKRRHKEEETRLGPGQYPFKSAILRKSLSVAAPAIRRGLEKEGVVFLYS